jgi:hypothetical protein
MKYQQNLTKLFICFLGVLVAVEVKGQANPFGSFFNESSLALYPGTVISADAAAEGGSAIFRGANTTADPVWYGPYANNLQAGNYLMQVRLKVSSNTSNAVLFHIDAVSNLGGTVYNRLAIRPDMFRKANEWQLFTIPIQLPANVSGLELRGIAFSSGIADLWFDYLILAPGDPRGIYTDEFTVTGTGSIGVGTNNPAEKLSVNGKIRAKEVKVETANWPDYVFSPSYKLPDLKETEKFIKANKHLPEIPSAAEVEKDGVSLGEMNARLLKKIEELTLYIIEQNKRIEKLESRK